MHMSKYISKNMNILLLTTYLMGTLYGAISGHYSFICVMWFLAALTYTGIFISGMVGLVGLAAMFVVRDTLFIPFYLLVLLLYLVWTGLYMIAKTKEAMEG